MGRGAVQCPPPLCLGFCPNYSNYQPIPEILNLAKLFVEDALMKKNQKFNLPTLRAL